MEPFSAHTCQFALLKHVHGDAVCIAVLFLEFPQRLTLLLDVIMQISCSGELHTILRLCRQSMDHSSSIYSDIYTSINIGTQKYS